MKRLPRPNGTYSADLKEVLTPAERRRHKALIARSCEKSRRYDVRSPNVRRFRSTASKSEKDFLVRIYRINRGALRKVKRRIFDAFDEHARGFCQYCGIGEPTTFDHYLEKSSVPELAIYARNLVPCCAACNNGRGRTFDKDTGQRRILHFFYDDVDALPRILRATITFDQYGTPTATFTVTPNANPLSVTLKNHFEALKLAKRYRKRSVSKLMSKRDEVFPLGLPDAELVRQLTISRDAIERAHGRNHWEAALLTALISSRAARDWLRT